jgi:signal transduction histidine kinase
MVAAGDLYVVVLALGGTVQLALAAYAWRHGSKPGARWFVAMAAFGAAWVLTDAIGMGFVGAGFPRLWLGNLNSAIATGTAVAWIGFVVTYTGRGHLLTPRRTVLLAALPAVTSAALIVTPTSPLVVEAYGFETVSGLSLVWIEAGTLVVAVEVYLFALLIALFGLVARAIVEEGEPFAGQLAWIVAGSLAVLVGASVDIFTLVEPPADVLGPSIGATIHTCTFAVALFRYRLLRLVPAVRHLGESDAIEDLDDGVVIVDDDGTIVRLNPAAGRILGVEPAPAPDGAIGADVRTLLPDVDDPLSASLEATVERGGRTYRVSNSPITGRGDRHVGRTLLLRDVTERERREQRLAVLGRVLRHNLRNDVDAIEGHASFVEHETDGDVARAAGTIRSLAMSMADLGDKARLAQETLDADADPEPVALAPLVDAAVADATDALPTRDPDLSVSVPDDATVVTHPTPLAVAVENVVENAIEHGDPSDPTVRVRTRSRARPRSDATDADRRAPGSSGRATATGDGGRTDATDAPGSATAVASASTPASGTASAPDDDSDPVRAEQTRGTTTGSDPATTDDPVDGATRAGDDGRAATATPTAAGPVEPADGVEIVVEDDGPGIPDHQVAVLEEGAETPLAHGDGIGLWLVHWAVGTLRGDVRFEPRDDGEEGSRVRIRVPDLGDGPASGPTG